MEDPSSSSATETQSKLAHSIDATQMAQQPMATNTQSAVTMMTLSLSAPHEHA